MSRRHTIEITHDGDALQYHFDFYNCSQLHAEFRDETVLLKLHSDDRGYLYSGQSLDDLIAALNLLRVQLPDGKA